MFFDGYNLHSTLVASRGQHEEMLKFSDFHGIKPVVETFELSDEGIAQAFGKLKKGSMRYRGVLVA